LALCSQIFDTTAYACLCVKYVSESVPTCSAIFFSSDAQVCKCAICKRSSVKKDRNCFNRQAPFDLTVEEFNFAVTLDSTISDIVNPKVGKRCLLSLQYMIDKEELIRTAPGTKTKIKKVLIEKRTGKYPNMDHVLATWVREMRQCGVPVVCWMLPIEGKRILDELFPNKNIDFRFRMWTRKGCHYSDGCVR
jgi:hypothetical protein